MILAVIAIFATQMMAKPQLSALKLGGRQSKSGIDTLFMVNVMLQR